MKSIVFAVVAAAGLSSAAIAQEPLTVLAYETAPFFQANASGAPSGLEYDILEYYAKKAGRSVRVRWVRNFDEILPMLARGEGDVAAATLTITPERQRTVDFTVSYFPVRVMLVEAAGKVSRTLESLRGQKIATMRGTTYEELARKIPDAQLVYGDNEAELFRMVESGQARAATADSAVAFALLPQHGGLALGLPLSDEQHYGFALPKGSAIGAELSKTITQLKTSNIYYRLLEKYLGDEAVRVVKSAKD